MCIKTIAFILIFSLNLKVGAQEVISPPSFLKNNSNALSEMHTNAYEMPDSSGFLFPMSLWVPFNQAMGNNFSSAKLIKSDLNGNVINSFTIAYDTMSRKAFRGLAACLLRGEVLFFVASDSVVNNNNPLTQGLIVFHLQPTNLTLTSVDAFLNLLPVNSSLQLWEQIVSNGSIYGTLTCELSNSNYSALLYKASFNSQNKFQIDIKPVNSQLVPPIDDNGFSNATSLRTNSSGDSLEFFLSAVVPKYFVTIDSLLQGAAFTSLSNNALEFFVSSSSFIPDPVVSNAIRVTNDKLIVGTRFDGGSAGDKIALIKYDFNTQLREKLLLFPDSIGFSYLAKMYGVLKTLDYRGGALYCLGSDFTSFPNYFNQVDNHLYVGKTDTVLSSWQWYKYIGISGHYLFPYRLMSTSDGGCLITCGFHDYLNNPNLDQDIYVIRLSANGFVTNITNLTPNCEKSVSLYPIPTQGLLFISYDGNDKFDLNIHDASGKLLLSKQGLSKTVSSISLNSISSGNYFYTVRFSNGKTETGKLVKL